MQNPYVVGKYCYLRHPTLEDAEGPWHEWFSDEETTRYLNLRYMPNSKESQIDFLQSTRNSSNRVVLSIVELETDQHIGVCNLSSINWVHGYTDMALIIGDKAFRTGPHIVDATSLLLRVAFRRLNLRMVKSDYVVTNEGSEIIHRLFRFKKTGQIDDIFWDGEAYVASAQTVLRREDWMRRQKKLTSKASQG